jgi:hypothetical protein
MNPSGRITRQEANNKEKSSKMFRPPKACKGRATSRIDEECRKIEQLNSNKPASKPIKQKAFEVPKGLKH